MGYNTEREHDGQKTLCKVRLVARGFQEEIKPHYNSPTALRDSFKFMLALSANGGFEIFSIDISAAFLQIKVLDHDVFVVPPADIK